MTDASPLYVSSRNPPRPNRGSRRDSFRIAPDSRLIAIDNNGESRIREGFVPYAQQTANADLHLALLSSAHADMMEMVI